MKILNLIIKQVYFDQIKSGKKKSETREVTPNTEKKYVIVEDQEITDIIKYDAIRFFVGYNKDRDTLLIEVKGSRLDEVHDEQDQPIFLEQKGEKYMAINIVYKLGKVLE